MNFDMENIDIAWCPGCGDFLILKILKQACAELNINPKELVTCSGIGQAAKTPHYFRTNIFNGLHGRALSPATAIKATNKNLAVIAISGDGDMYGEGGNHFVHTIRRNPNITNIVNNNMVYGLTKGQASPSSEKGFVTEVQCKGTTAEPFNPIATAISLDASFVARVFCQDQEHSKEIIKKAILHKGYALVDIFQPCPTYNKINTYKWFKEHTYYLKNHDTKDRNEAFKVSTQTEKLPLGIFYTNEDKTVFEDTAAIKNTSDMNLFKRRENRSNKLKELIKSYI